jgi:RNA polymerase primary sigma factor
MLETAKSTFADCDSSRPSMLKGRSERGLSRAEEYELAARISGGDRQARNRMVQANMALVINVARAFAGHGLSIEDLIGEGILGLIRAADGFDPKFGTRFRTYAEHWIKEAIRAALTNTGATIRLPRCMARLLTKWARAERASARQLGRLPDFDAVASKIGLSKRQQRLVAKARHARQVTLETDWGGPARLWLSDVAQNGRSIEAMLEADEEQDIIRRRVGSLDARERAVLSLRYGLEGERLSNAEIGRRLGCSREWVRKIELRSYRKLRAALSGPPESLKTRIESLYNRADDRRHTKVLGGVVSTSKCDFPPR